MENENILEILIEDIENILTDIFLSGFYAIQTSSLEKIEEKSKLAKELGMKKLGELLENFKVELNKRKNSFDFDLIRITENFCKIEFYIEHLKKMQD